MWFIKISKLWPNKLKLVKSLMVLTKGGFNLNHFKVQFNKNISRKNKIEIIDMFNNIEQKNETFIKVTHSFGVFLYDLNHTNNKHQNIIHNTVLLLFFYLCHQKV